MLDKINILKPIIPLRIKEKKKDNIKHIAISLAETKFFDKTKYNINELLQIRNSLVLDLISYQIKNNITVMTIYLLGNKELQNLKYLDKVMEYLSQLFNVLTKSSIITDNKVKIFVLGKWYDLSGKVVDNVKCSLDTTKDYDNFFLNFCINYDGQEEIVSATKIMARKVKFGKIEIDDISAKEIKENIYSSYFIPPDKIIIPSKRKKLLSFLLWDAAFSKIVFIDKDWKDISAKELIER